MACRLRTAGANYKHRSFFCRWSAKKASPFITVRVGHPLHLPLPAHRLRPPGSGASLTFHPASLSSFPRSLVAALLRPTWPSTRSSRSACALTPSSRQASNRTLSRTSHPSPPEPPPSRESPRLDAPAAESHAGPSTEDTVDQVPPTRSSAIGRRMRNVEEVFSALEGEPRLHHGETCRGRHILLFTRRGRGRRWFPISVERFLGAPPATRSSFGGSITPAFSTTGDKTGPAGARTPSESGHALDQEEVETERPGDASCKSRYRLCRGPRISRLRAPRSARLMTLHDLESVRELESEPRALPAPSPPSAVSTRRCRPRRSEPHINAIVVPPGTAPGNKLFRPRRPGRNCPRHAPSGNHRE